VQIELGATERRTLVGLIEKQIEWKPALVLRVVTSPSAVGFYSALPLDVHVFIAMPATIGGAAPFDRIVHASSLLNLLMNDQSPKIDLNALEAVESLAGTSLVEMPPTNGWQIPMTALASDIVPIVNEAAEEFDRRSKGLGERGMSDLADEIWERPGWAGLPVRMLHAAVRLQLLWNEPVKVSAATCGPWKRLSTPRGQVFAYATGPAARTGLRIVN
jgi:hypothetical protein